MRICVLAPGVLGTGLLTAHYRTVTASMSQSGPCLLGRGDHKILRVNFAQFFSPLPPVGLVNVTSLKILLLDFCQRNTKAWKCNIFLCSFL